jgi:hypothetical protein
MSAKSLPELLDGRPIHPRRGTIGQNDCLANSFSSPRFAAWKSPMYKASKSHKKLRRKSLRFGIYCVLGAHPSRRFTFRQDRFESDPSESHTQIEPVRLRRIDAGEALADQVLVMGNAIQV